MWRFLQFAMTLLATESAAVNDKLVGEQPAKGSMTQKELDAYVRETDEMHAKRKEFNQKRLDTFVNQTHFLEERLRGMEMNSEILKSWIDENSNEYWEEVERVNQKLAEQEASFSDLMYFLEYEKQTKALDTYSLALDYIQDLANLEGEVMALRVRAQADRNEWAFRFQEVMISAELQNDRCTQEIERIDTQLDFVTKILQDVATYSNNELTEKLVAKFGLKSDEVDNIINQTE